jgi:UDP-N-acetylmuramate dehydrogenase
MELATGRVNWLSAQECAFGYRESIFKGELAGSIVITQLVLRLSRTPAPRLGYGDLAARLASPPTPLAVAEAVCGIRREKLPDPQVLANAGSFFKNPLAVVAAVSCYAPFPPGRRANKAGGGVVNRPVWLERDA